MSSPMTRSLWAVIRALGGVAWAALHCIPCLFGRHRWTILLDPGNYHCTRCGLERPAWN